MWTFWANVPDRCCKPGNKAPGLKPAQLLGRDSGARRPLLPPRMLKVALEALHVYGRRGFGILTVHGALRNVRIARSRVGMFRDKASEKIVRGGTGVVLRSRS